MMNNNNNDDDDNDDDDNDETKRLRLQLPLTHIAHSRHPATQPHSFPLTTKITSIPFYLYSAPST